MHLVLIQFLMVQTAVETWFKCYRTGCGVTRSSCLVLALSRQLVKLVLLGVIPAEKAMLCNSKLAQTIALFGFSPSQGDGSDSST